MIYDGQAFIDYKLVYNILMFSTRILFGLFITFLVFVKKIVPALPVRAKSSCISTTFVPQERVD